MRELFAQAGMETEEIGADEQADAMNAVQQEEIDLLIVFPQDFDAAVRAYDVSAGEAAPNIEIYYNSASADSSAAFEQVQGMLDQYESALSNCFDINRGQEGYDLADDRDLAGMTMASMMPLLILIFLFSGCMAVGAGIHRRRKGKRNDRDDPGHADPPQRTGAGKDLFPLHHRAAQRAFFHGGDLVVHA